jgi:hypothetical protein
VAQFRQLFGFPLAFLRKCAKAQSFFGRGAKKLEENLGGSGERLLEYL